ncbi:MAG: GNAT family N-acetyltransferase [Ardenticatenaceae bacterium]|nr:GNAT family N-acetyltransferase [Ardenticatenaceae bacterium]MCB8949929.1 GNAT family N-acetyltransferase [Ardenticatenaceae bacterium]
MFRLNPSQYAAAIPLFEELADFNVYVTAVLQQKSPGRVYLDSLDAPKSGFLVSLDRSYLAGNPENQDFNRALRDELHATLLAGDRINPVNPELVLTPDSPDWEPALADILADWRWPPVWGINQYYSFDTLRVNWRDSLPPGYTITHLDAVLLAEQGLSLPIHIVDSIRLGWENEANFLTNGFGMAALYDEEMVCWCLADVTVGDACEIGIETIPGHRGRGVATAVTAATVEHYAAKGYKHIGWHCEASNKGSIRVAEKVGFVMERPYNDYTFGYEESRHYAELGRLYFFEAQMYEEAASMLEIAIEVDDAPPAYVYFLAARALAHLEEPEAIDYLHEAIDAGFKDWRLLESLPEFAPYRSDPDFPTSEAS